MNVVLGFAVLLIADWLVVRWIRGCRIHQRKEARVSRARNGKRFHLVRADRSGRVLGMTADPVDAVTAVTLQAALRRQGFIATIHVDSATLRRWYAAGDARVKLQQADVLVVLNDGGAMHANVGAN